MVVPLGRSSLGTQESTAPSTIGLFGGTFNPIHNCHLTIARLSREAVGLEKVVFIPSGTPPHKPGTDLAPAKDRLEMVRLAIEGEPAYAVSDAEIRRPGKSFTIDTVRLMMQEYGPQARLSFLIGLDAFLDVETWREPEALLALCSFVVISRPGLSFQSLTRLNILPAVPVRELAELDEEQRAKLEWPIGLQGITCLRLPPCDISASDIRTRVSRGQSVAGLLPPTVESYILHHHLYE
ncbi:MAG TPA: nicotinate-nucleotide adenylyltransferase [Nitrospira sp.]|nr:nicotinate-nucleotide adenylyltransferase [Nitrospira sp.]